MRRKTESYNCISFENGLAIKGSYSLSLGGVHVTLYLINKTGHIFANRTYGFSKHDEPQEKLQIMMVALKQICHAVKLDEITQPRIQEAACKAVMERLTKQAVFKTA